VNTTAPDRGGTGHRPVPAGRGSAAADRCRWRSAGVEVVLVHEVMVHEVMVVRGSMDRASM